jgi:hypothetical protein
VRTLGRRPEFPRAGYFGGVRFGSSSLPSRLLSQTRGGFEVVRVVTAPTFAFGPAAPVKRQFTPGAPTFRAMFDMMADGRFIGVVPLGGNENIANNNPGIQVVLGWFDELQAKVPL